MTKDTGSVVAMGDTKKEKDVLQKFTDGIRYAPDAIFDFGDDKSKYDRHHTIILYITRFFMLLVHISHHLAFYSSKEEAGAYVPALVS